MNYCAGYIRQQENQQLGIPLEIARRFPRRLQELCGYSIYNGLIGHIDKQHPGKLLLGTEEDTSLVWDYAKAARSLIGPASGAARGAGSLAPLAGLARALADDSLRRSACLGRALRSPSWSPTSARLARPSPLPVAAFLGVLAAFLAGVFAAFLAAFLDAAFFEAASCPAWPSWPAARTLPDDHERPHRRSDRRLLAARPRHPQQATADAGDDPVAGAWPTRFEGT